MQKIIDVMRRMLYDVGNFIRNWELAQRGELWLQRNALLC